MAGAKLRRWPDKRDPRSHSAGGVRIWARFPPYESLGGYSASSAPIGPRRAPEFPASLVATTHGELFLTGLAFGQNGAVARCSADGIGSVGVRPQFAVLAFRRGILGHWVE
jgi:hypothetical protein